MISGLLAFPSCIELATLQVAFPDYTFRRMDGDRRYEAVVRRDRDMPIYCLIGSPREIWQELATSCGPRTH